RITGMPMDDGDDKGPSARRGLLLEPAALHLLNERWRPVDPTTWQPYGDDLGSTPDALVDHGRGTLDLKCPANPADVVRFGMDVQDGDFLSLCGWNRNYAWQVMVQALTCGCNEAHLVYFTDRLPVHKLTNDERDVVQDIIDHRAEQYSQESTWPWSYTYASQGYLYVARSFTLTDEIRERILATLDRAVKE